MKIPTFNPSSVIQLAGIFFGVALLMASYESMKELIFMGDLTAWESHSVTIFVTAVFATAASFFMRKWAVGEAEVRIAATAFETQDGMVITDARRVILRVNHSFTAITGYTADEAVGQTLDLLKSDRHDESFYAALWESVDRTGKWQGEIWSRRKNGEVYPERLAITAVKGGNRAISHYVSTMHDITHRKQAEEQIRVLAFYDNLTQLPNRRLLNDRLEQAISANKRSGSYGALMFLDLDNFKTLNDTQGHSAGDALLIEAAHRLVSCVREVDTVARFGGDEFVVMINNQGDDKDESSAHASIVAKKICASLSVPYLLKVSHEGKAQKTVEHQSSASIGVVMFGQHEVDKEDLLKWADLAMYQAKNAGRNQFRFYEAGTIASK